MRSLTPMNSPKPHPHVLSNLKRHFDITLKKFWNLSTRRKSILVLSLAALYCFFLGRPRYLVTSSFIIRSASDNSSISSGSIFSALNTNSNVSRSVEDGRYLSVYLASPKTYDHVFQPFIIKGFYSVTFPDPLSGIWFRRNRDERYMAFYSRQVSLTTDELSGVITLRTFAYNPLVSLKLNNLLLERSKIFVNTLNTTIGETQLQYSLIEVKRAEKALSAANDRLINFNRTNQLVNAQSEIDSTSAYLTALQGNLVTERVELGRLKRTFQDQQVPEILAQENKVKELDSQIASERARLSSLKVNGLSAQGLDSARLQQDVDTAVELLRTSKLSLERSRMESQQNLKLVVLLSNPVLSQTQDYSWRIKLFFGLCVLYLICNGLYQYLNKRKCHNS